MLIFGWSAALIKLEHSFGAFSTLSGDDKFAAELSRLVKNQLSMLFFLYSVALFGISKKPLLNQHFWKKYIAVQPLNQDIQNQKFLFFEALIFTPVMLT